MVWSIKANDPRTSETSECGKRAIESTLLTMPTFREGRPNCFMDKNYLVGQFMNDPNNRTVFATFSVHPLKDNSSVELRPVTTFDVESCDQFQYQDGLLVFALENGEIT